MKRLFAVCFGSFLCAGYLTAFAQSEAPAITTQPTSQTIESGQEVTFSVGASGSSLQYQWFFNSAEILDATNASLTISSVSTNDAGNYVVMVSNESGNQVSDIAVLTVVEGSGGDGEETPVSGEPILDFNGDSKPDLLWVHPDGRMAAWLMDGTNFLSSILLPYTAPRGWRMAGQADFDHDGKVDFLWQKMNGAVSIWLMDGTNRLDTVNVPRKTSGGWRIVGLSDFDNDGNTDLLWQHGNGSLAVWFMNGTSFDHSVAVNEGKRFKGGWKIVGLLDVDNDGDDDFLWQHGGGRVAVWYMNGINLDHTEFLKTTERTSSSWHIVSCFDLDGDGEKDFVWQNSSGFLAAWLLKANQPIPSVLRNGHSAGKGWEIEKHGSSGH